MPKLAGKCLMTGHYHKLWYTHAHTHFSVDVSTKNGPHRQAKLRDTRKTYGD